MEPGATMIRGTLLPAGRRWAGFVCLSWAAACAPPPQAEPKAASAGEWRAFEGTWSAAGKRHTLELAPDHRASCFYITGSLRLSRPHRLGFGFRAKPIGLVYSRTVTSVRCVWYGELGYVPFNELHGASVST